jgi:hypothetical protein
MATLDRKIRRALTPDEQTRVRQRGSPLDGRWRRAREAQHQSTRPPPVHPFPAAAPLNHTQARLARGARYAPGSNSQGPINVYSMMGSNRRGRSCWGQAQTMQEAGQPRKSCSELRHARDHSGTISTIGRESRRRIATNARHPRHPRQGEEPWPAPVPSHSKAAEEQTALLGNSYPGHQLRHFS